MVTGSSHSISMCPPHSPTRITKKSILKLPGAFHWPKTSRIRFWAFSYSIGEPCGRSDQVSMYFIGSFLDVNFNVGVGNEKRFSQCRLGRKDYFSSNRVMAFSPALERSDYAE